MTAASVEVAEVAIQGSQAGVPVPNLGNVTSGFVFVGGSGTVVKDVTIHGFRLTTANPAVVVLQPRQNDNVPSPLPDAFAVQVIHTTATSIRCLIRRLDRASGWDQNLRIDIWVVDQFHN